MMMPSAEFAPVRTSQKERFVWTPSPRSDGHSNIAGSVRVAGAAARPLVGARPRAPVVWASRTPLDAVISATSSAARMRMSVVDTGQSSARGHGLQQVAAVADQLEEFRSGARVIAEDPQHRAGHRERVLLLDAAHRHAQVGAFAYHRDPERVDLLEDRLGHLVGEPFLDLQPARKCVHQAGDLAETDDVPLRDVGDVALAEKWQQMVLAEAVEIDVLDDHHLAVIDGEQCAIEDGVDIGVISAGQEFHCLADPERSAHEALAAGILTELDQQPPDEFLHAAIVPS